jgi:hypothetical protein
VIDLSLLPSSHPFLQIKLLYQFRIKVPPIFHPDLLPRDPRPAIGSGPSPFLLSLINSPLSQMTALFLSQFCTIDTERKNVELPRICSWYLRDFSKRPNGSLPIDCLRVIMPYLRESDRFALLAMIEEGVSPNIQFRSFVFRCRTLTRLEPPLEVVTVT